MNDQPVALPSYYDEILKASQSIGFSMPSDLQTGSLLRTLVTSRPDGNFLELGTGTGLSLAWMVAGMSVGARLTTLDVEERYISIARGYFSSDTRVEFVQADGAEWLRSYSGERFDLIFADAWPGKYECLDEALAMLKPGGIYVIDDMLPQPNWPAGHDQQVDRLIKTLQGRPDLNITQLNWSTGLVIATKIVAIDNQ